MAKWIDILVPFAMAIFGIVGGVAGKEFYPGRIGSPPRGKPWPKWFGRLWFIGFGLVFLYFSIRNFLHR